MKLRANVSAVIAGFSRLKGRRLREDEGISHVLASPLHKPRPLLKPDFFFFFFSHDYFCVSRPFQDLNLSRFIRFFASAESKAAALRREKRRSDRTDCRYACNALGNARSRRGRERAREGASEGGRGGHPRASSARAT